MLPRGTIIQTLKGTLSADGSSMAIRRNRTLFAFRRPSFDNHFKSLCEVMAAWDRCSRGFIWTSESNDGVERYRNNSATSRCVARTCVVCNNRTKGTTMGGTKPMCTAHSVSASGRGASFIPISAIGCWVLLTGNPFFCPCVSFAVSGPCCVCFRVGTHSRSSA